MDEWQGRVALITGGASGIGLATAQAFARRGVSVVIADLDQEGGQRAARLVDGSAGQALFEPCDVADRSQVEALVATTVQRFGRLDFAFNNAGWEGPMAPTAEYTEDDWDRVVAVNLKGVWLCMRSEMRQMLRQRRGAIVNAASVAALISERGYPAYSAAKGGVLQLTRTAAVEYAGSGIRINAVCPGVIHTEMIDRARRNLRPSAMMPGMLRTPASRWFADHVLRRPFRAVGMRMLTPLGRMGRPQEIAEAVVWLCSEAAAFITGQHLTIDGGMVVA